jgi:polyhydroxyalkanoate synthesis regulator phasin
LKEVAMLDLFKKSMLTGIGLALKTWDEVEALGKELEEKGKMPREEAKKFIEELQARYEETQAKLEERVEKSVRDFLKKADIVTGEDLKALKTEIRDLKKLISQSPED